LQFAAEDVDEGLDSEFDGEKRFGDKIVAADHGRFGAVIQVVEVGDKDDGRGFVAGEGAEFGFKLSGFEADFGAAVDRSRKVSQPRPDAKRALLSKPRDPADPESVVDHLVRFFGVIGSPAFPTDGAALREQVAHSVRRGHHPAGVTRQLVAILASGDRRKLLPKITAPTLVIHGAEDPLVPVEAGRDTARHIAGAELMVIEGMGHDLAPGLVPILVEAIAAHCHGSGKG